MAQICIPTPPLDHIRTVDVQVTIDGHARQAQYRVETLHWPETPDERMEALRSFIASRKDEWLLVQIGSPSRYSVPILFRHRELEGYSAASSDQT